MNTMEEIINVTSTPNQPESDLKDVQPPLNPRKRKASETNVTPLTSMMVFAKYIRMNEVDYGTGKGYKIDASGIFSRECYEEWIATRCKKLKQPEQSFRKALTAHVKGVDRRKPFAQEIEVEVLRILRQEKCWPCFKDSNYSSKIGIRGFKSKGYWESRAMEKTIAQEQVYKEPNSEMQMLNNMWLQAEFSKILSYNNQHQGREQHQHFFPRQEHARMHHPNMKLENFPQYRREPQHMRQDSWNGSLNLF
eukprot:snap_masked-scaffold_54-processed-gene-1.39-mRNA-1 protein AED:0.27 eAED:1.00 QI:0/-1/0/1/-1/1/1/0/249